MKKKIWLAGILIIAGLVLAFIALASAGFDFSKLASVTVSPISETVTEPFTDISIETDTCDVEFLPAEDGGCKIIGTATELQPISVTVQDGTLVIRQADNRKWYDYISLFGGNCKVTVYLPEALYNQLTLSGGTGDIVVPAGFTFGDVSVSVSTGDVFFAAGAANLTVSTSTGHVTVQDLHTDGDVSISVSTGDINLTNVLCKDLRITADTGDVTITACDCETIEANTDTGDVTGSLLTEKIFDVETDTGNVVVPDTTSGGTCKVTTDTGDIHFTIK